MSATSRRARQFFHAFARHRLRPQETLPIAAPFGDDRGALHVALYPLGVDIEFQRAAKRRPDMKLVINRAWGDPQSRLNGLFQLTKGLSKIARKAEVIKRKQAA